MKKIAFGVLITSLIVFALCFLFVLVGIIEIEEPRRIINVFLVLLGILVVVGFAHGGKWLYDEKLNPVDRAYATLVDMRVEKQTAPSRTHLTETDVVLFSTKFGMFELEDSSLLELILNSKCNVVEVGVQGELIYRNNHALDFIVNGG